MDIIRNVSVDRISVVADLRRFANATLESEAGIAAGSVSSSFSQIVETFESPSDGGRARRASLVQVVEVKALFLVTVSLFAGLARADSNSGAKTRGRVQSVSGFAFGTDRSQRSAGLAHFHKAGDRGVFNAAAIICRLVTIWAVFIEKVAFSSGIMGVW